ncbi:MAG: hypothetical protein FJY19_01565 [Bacteroidetes bacterium]|nr:hypothetical protein [Bacteroidota bacterium]
MSLNHLQLTPDLIATLYDTKLIGENNSNKPANRKEVEEDPPTQPRFLGKHKSNILVIVNEPNAVFLQDPQLTYLTKILNACLRTVEDIALVNYAKHPAETYRTLQSTFPSKLILLFGVTPAQLQLPIDFPNYQLQKLESVVFLQAPALQLIESSKPDREQLWQSLKKYFDV